MRTETAARSRRLRLICAVAVAAAILYVITFLAVRPLAGAVEQSVGSRTRAGGVPIYVYADIVSIDPIRASMELRLDVASGPGPRGTHRYGTLTRDIELHVDDGESEQDVRLLHGAALASHTFVAGINGAIGRYPFDRYTSRIVLRAYEIPPSGSPIVIPIDLTVWEGIGAWVVHAAPIPPARAAPEVGLAFSIGRPSAHIYFACVLLAIIAIIAASAVTICTLTFVGVRRIEPTLISAVTAMAFALPVLRNVFPGTPPLGITADIFVFLWAELAVATGLAFFVVAWARRGAKP